jgi:predicted nucleic-acid-binding protein
MMSIDTNIILSILLRDDTQQYNLARNFLNDNAQILITKTTLLECFWVLHKAYKIQKSVVLDKLIEFCALPNIHIEEEFVILSAFKAAQNGLDFADALHLYSSYQAESFITFDRAFAHTAKQINTSPPVLELA